MNIGLIVFVITFILFFASVSGILFFILRVIPKKSKKALAEKTVILPNDMSRFKYWWRSHFSKSGRAEHQEDLQKSKGLAVAFKKPDLDDLESTTADGKKLHKRKNKDGEEVTLTNQLKALFEQSPEAKRIWAKSNLDISLIDNPSFPDQLFSFPEEKVRAKYVFSLMEEYGVDISQIDFEQEVRIGSKTGKVDIAVFPKNVPHMTQNARIFVECKKQTADEATMKGAVEQLKSYMIPVPEVTLGIVTSWANTTFYKKEFKDGAPVISETKPFSKTDFTFTNTTTSTSTNNNEEDDF